MCIETVRGNVKNYSKREVKKADEARKYLRKLGVVTPEELIKLISRNAIKNNDISVQDVARAIEILGKDLANLNLCVA